MSDERESVGVEIKYKKGHSYRFTYDHADLFCPSCGERSVWVERGPGDYYMGPSMVCTTCDSRFTVNGLSDATDVESQVIQQIRADHDPQEEADDGG